MNLFNNKKRIITLVCFILIITMSIVCFIFNSQNNGLYSKREINNVRLNDIANEIAKKNNLEQGYLVDYLKDFMEQYNHAKKNNEVVELTTKGKKFETYFKNLDSNITSTSEGREYMRFLLEFFQLSGINAKAQLEQLNYKNILEPQTVIINENYSKYLEDIKNQINTLLGKYCEQ